MVIPDVCVPSFRSGAREGAFLLESACGGSKREFVDAAQVPSRRVLNGCWVYVCMWCSFISFVFYRFRVIVWCVPWGWVHKVRLTLTGSGDHGEPRLTAVHQVRNVTDRAAKR